ncbi:MAG: D-(-)-3-hydroxybutyrate oligomer hydrolase [Desulfobacteraceae bacterium]|nr:D-(-)-3-hydroxybutyrate oligomer hydrolase [Desulfobacteraceae bacterium]
MNTKPDFIKGEISRKDYDGIKNDLLTGGLGKTGLQSPVPPVVENFTAEELRTLAVYYNYRAMVDITTAGGFGVLFGPNVGADGLPGNGEGKIAGREYIAYSDDGTGRQNVTMMVQVPDSFDPNNPCIITAPSSGSRGIYGAIATVGEWGLKRGFAVAYTDKGAGTGMHDLDSDTVNLITGRTEKAGTAGKNSIFTAKPESSFLKENPHSIAFKHAHSQQNPQADWGKYVLQSVKFAFYILNNLEKKTVTPENTIVIASSVSNGGGASVRAAEQDTENLIKGVAVSEPNVSPVKNESVVIRQGDEEWAYPNNSRELFDLVTLLNIYQPCACLDPKVKDIAPMNLVDEQLGIGRCNSLAEKGLLTKSSPEDRAAEAQELINSYGILPEQNIIQPSHHAMQAFEGIAVTYANAYGRFSVQDKLCGFSFAAVDPETKKPAPLAREQAEVIFGTSGGIPPVPGVELINNNSEDGPMLNRESISSSGAKDQNLEGVLCLRRLATGKDDKGNPLAGKELEQHERIKKGISETLASGNLKGLPVVIVHGRDDAILPPNHTSRAYAALNSLAEGAGSNLRYYEVTNAHHLDMLNGFDGFNSRYVPLNFYFIQALDLLYDHLRKGAPLPDSQLVRTRPRRALEDNSVPEITKENVPVISVSPAEGDKITVEKGIICIPS